MSMQPPSGDQWVNIAAAGTTVSSDTGGVSLKKIILPGTFVGSVEWYDSATAAGTAATNLVYNVGIPLLNQYKSIDINARFRNGMVVVATGTPTLTYTKD